MKYEPVLFQSLNCMALHCQSRSCRIPARKMRHSSIFLTALPSRSHRISKVKREILWILGNPNHLHRNLSRGLQRRFVSMQARASSRGDISSWFNQQAWSFQSDYQHECEIGLGVCPQASSISGNTKAANKGNSFPVSGGWFALPCGEGVRRANPGEPCHCHQPSVFGGESPTVSVLQLTGRYLVGNWRTSCQSSCSPQSDLQRSSFTCNRLGAHVLQGQWQWKVPERKLWKQRRTPSLDLEGGNVHFLLGVAVHPPFSSSQNHQSLACQCLWGRGSQA